MAGGLWQWDALTASLDAGSAAAMSAFTSYAIGSGVYVQAAVAFQTSPAGTQTDSIATSESVSPVVVPIPVGTRPGSTFDASMTIYDVAGQKQWDISGQTAYNATSGKITSAFGVAYVDLAAGSVQPYETGPGGNNSNAAKLNYLAGLVMPAEIQAGLIKHALHFTIPNVAPGSRYPADPTISNSGYSGNTGLSVGSWVRLDPAVNVAGTAGLLPWERTIAVAMQKYGMFVRDIGTTLSIHIADLRNQGGNGTAWPAVDSTLTLPLLINSYPYAQQFTSAFVSMITGHLQLLQAPTTTISNAGWPYVDNTSVTGSAPTTGPYGNAVLIDDFNRASIGANWTASDMNANGSVDPPAVIVGSTQLAGSVNADWSGYYNVANYGPDVEAVVQVATAANFKMFVRFNPTTFTGYLMRWSTGGPLTIKRQDNVGGHGAWTDIATSSFIVTSGEWYALAARGSTIEVWKWTGTAWTLVLSATDATYNASARVGLAGADNVVRLDNFMAGTIVAGGGGGRDLPILGVG